MAVIVVVGLANTLVGSGYAYLRWRLGHIDRVDVPGLAEGEGRVMNVLLVGSDSRSRLTGEAAAQAGKGEVTGERTDTIIMVHIDSPNNRAMMVSIPRDLYVPIAGTNRSDRINTAFSSGGPPRLIATVQDSLGIEVNHYAEVDFVGFQGIVDAVGGVTVYVPAPARDDYSGFEIGEPGCRSFDGQMALAWVRSRSYEYLSEGQWIQDPRADLGRIQRQQDFIRRTINKAVSSGLSNPLTLNRLLAIGTANLTIDSGMSTRDMTALARRFQSLDPDAIETRTLPTTEATIDGASVLVLNRQEAQADIDVMNGIAPAIAAPPPAAADPDGPSAAAPATTVPAISPGDIRVRVLNGSGVKGRAAKAAAALKAGGFTIAGTGDAQGRPSGATIVRYRPGAVARASVVAGSLLSEAELQQDPAIKNADVELVLGTQDDGVRESTASAAATTTTTTTALPTPVPRGAPEKTC